MNFSILAIKSHSPSMSNQIESIIELLQVYALATQSIDPPLFVTVLILSQTHVNVKV